MMLSSLLSFVAVRILWIMGLDSSARLHVQYNYIHTTLTLGAQKILFFDDDLFGQIQ